MADADDRGSVGEEEGGKDLWSSILSEVSSSASRKLPSNKSIVLLGYDGSGKTTLISKLRGKEDEISKGHGLEYTYLDVHDEERDDSTRLGVWILDGDPLHKNLLQYALTVKSINNAVIVQVVDISRPWTIMESLHSWTEVLREHIHSLKLPPKELNEMEERIVRQFQEYVEPDEANEDRRRSGIKDEDRVLLPLDENILSDNLGLPMVVVVTKVSQCILVVECASQDKVDMCVNIPFLFYSMFTDDEKIMIKNSWYLSPAGWDSVKKINILSEHLKVILPEDRFEDHIVKPQLRKPIQDKEIVAEDEQTFLAKQQQLLQKMPVATGIARPQQEIPKSRAAASPGRVGTDRRNSAGMSPVPRGPKVEGAKPGPGGAASEGVLANFFNSLLNKKSGAGAAPGRGGTAVRSDAAAELDRMNRAKKMVSQTNPSPNDSTESS
ncbi:PREDICTED: cytoplasmic dynein 1 light intermediate chain 1-like [Acropora digitifera]|uniref:cytoplasmic dynein 1 light intermediate chain 1-like n=1 Tax=Acropora digitifera TaxID=70779 RepID=UPI00077AD29A|nr:PREDICTED: cytoplasmic dynein 1 light intermediate chain 1-like [Acropora digitifera]